MNCSKCGKVLVKAKGKIRCSCGAVSFGPPRGAGDVIERVIHNVIGDTKCGACEKRRDLANELIPFKSD